jgi:hypothetical protein
VKHSLALIALFFMFSGRVLADTESELPGYPYEINVRVPFTRQDVDVYNHVPGHQKPGAPIDRPYVRVTMLHAPLDSHIQVPVSTLGQSLPGNFDVNWAFQKAASNGGWLEGKLKVDILDFWQTIGSPGDYSCWHFLSERVDLHIDGGLFPLTLEGGDGKDLGSVPGECPGFSPPK